VLLSSNNIFRLCSRPREVSRLLRADPSQVGYQAERSRPRLSHCRSGSRRPRTGIGDVDQAIYVPADDYTDPLREVRLRHLTATTALSRPISEKGIYRQSTRSIRTSTILNGGHPRRGPLPRSQPSSSKILQRYRRSCRTSSRSRDDELIATRTSLPFSVRARFERFLSQAVLRRRAVSPARPARTCLIAENDPRVRRDSWTKHDEVPESAFFLRHDRPRWSRPRSNGAQHVSAEIAERPRPRCFSEEIEMLSETRTPGPARSGFLATTSPVLGDAEPIRAAPVSLGSPTSCRSPRLEGYPAVRRESPRSCSSRRRSRRQERRSPDVPDACQRSAVSRRARR